MPMVRVSNGGTTVSGGTYVYQTFNQGSGSITYTFAASKDDLFVCCGTSGDLGQAQASISGDVTKLYEKYVSGSTAYLIKANSAGNITFTTYGTMSASRLNCIIFQLV